MRSRLSVFSSKLSLLNFKAYHLTVCASVAWDNKMSFTVVRRIRRVINLCKVFWNKLSTVSVLAIIILIKVK